MTKHIEIRQAERVIPDPQGFNIREGALAIGTNNPHGCHLIFTSALSAAKFDARWRNGFVTDAVAQDLQDFAGWKAYIAGPPSMDEAALQLCTERGLRTEDLHAEVFHPPAEGSACEQAPGSSAEVDKSQEDKTMNIGQASRFSGVSAKMIRYYEKVGLIPKAIRSDAGYRNYSSHDAHSLCFIRRARDLGFSVDQIAKLLVLWRDRDRACVHVKEIALSHVAGLKTKIAELQAMEQKLEHLISHCHGDDRPGCPILTNLAEHPTRAAAAKLLHPRPRTPRFGIDTPASSRHRSKAVAHS